uniref:Uncharacterized protein n=1 Tax=Arundo donax TaxID=35708 RepID=A0A0A9G4A7_ARUDO
MMRLRRSSAGCLPARLRPAGWCASPGSLCSLIRTLFTST